MEGGGSAAVEVLVQNLIDVTKGEISLIRGLNKNAHKLQNSLILVHSYLDDAEKKLITDEAIKTWLKQLDDMAFDAHNVLDELNYHLLSKKMKSVRREKKKKVLPSCFPPFNDYVRRRHMALRINEIYVRFESSLDHATKLGLHSRPAIAYALPEETDPHTLDPVFIGRDNDVSNIVHKMLTSEEPCFVLPIVGMGGLGKTTLTRKVFNHERVETHFQKKIWIHVSKKFDAVTLLKKILANLTSGNVEDESRVILLDKIRKVLGDKTYLLVLDDVWNEDAQMWEGFKNSLSGITSTTGNFILVTTRSKQVALIVRTFDVHNLNVLSNEDCWSIIKQKAGGKGDHIPPGFESIAIDIAKRCQGLPLAAKVVGGLLYRTPKDEWISIAHDWLSNLQVDDNDISKILKLSFDHLSPPSLKRCFAYCSIFPKGETINKHELVELWMAQGFLQIDPENGMEVEGNRFFYFLVQNSLLQVANRDKNGNITHCSMHDLVHDLACIVSKGIYQVQYIGRESDGGESSCVPKECWRTLIFKGEILSHTMLLAFKSLHTLTVMGYHVKELPSSISESIHLRYLKISQSGIQELPDSIGYLYHLQTLRVDFLSKLPSSVQYLINLRHLHIRWDTKLPPNIGRLTCLQTLENYHVGKDDGHGIGELGMLNNIQGDLNIFNIENVQHGKEAESARLFEKPKLSKLELKWSNTREGEINDENVLEGLRPHPNLKKLVISGFKGTRFPSWTINMAEGLNNLMEVSLSHCSVCDEIPMMGKLPHLKYLSLNMINVKSIRCSFMDSSCNETIVVFPVLQRLYLSKMSNLVELIEIELPENHPVLDVKVFPCLEYLTIDNCKQVRIASSVLNCGLPLPIICKSLKSIDIKGVDGLECLPDWFLNNQNLSKFRILRCGKLRELPDGLHTLTSLKELSIQECPNLKSIPYRSDGEFQGLTSLECLSIQSCNGLISIPCEMVESCAPSLQSLYLSNLSSLISLPLIIECLPKMPRLRFLAIENVPKLIPAPSCLHNLEYLCINPAASDSNEDAKKGVDGMLQAASPHSLHSLNLHGMEDWDSLPHSLRLLNALSDLQLRNFRMQELPEWFGNLKSLRTLQISNCKELRRVEPMRGLQKLTQFWITDCHSILKSSLEQHTSDDVSHVPGLWIDGQQFRGDGRNLDSYRCN